MGVEANAATMGRTSDYPTGAVPVLGASNVMANGVATATLVGSAGTSTYLCGFQVSAAGATAETAVVVSVTGMSKTLRYIFVAPADPTGLAVPLNITFTPPIVSAAPNTNISVSLPALGAGNTFASVNAWGYLL